MLPCRVSQRRRKLAGQNGKQFDIGAFRIAGAKAPIQGCPDCHFNPLGDQCLTAWPRHNSSKSQGFGTKR